MQVGSKVKCLAPSIDARKGQGEIGYVKGFARFSAYHAQEVLISNNADGPPTEAWCGWFWLRDVEPTN